MSALGLDVAAPCSVTQRVVGLFDRFYAHDGKPVAAVYGGNVYCGLYGGVCDLDVRVHRTYLHGTSLADGRIWVHDFITRALPSHLLRLVRVEVPSCVDKVFGGLERLSKDHYQTPYGGDYFAELELFTVRSVSRPASMVNLEFRASQEFLHHSTLRQLLIAVVDPVFRGLYPNSV